jgi:hypothetical protein
MASQTAQIGSRRNPVSAAARPMVANPRQRAGAAGQHVSGKEPEEFADDGDAEADSGDRTLAVGRQLAGKSDVDDQAEQNGEDSDDRDGDLQRGPAVRRQRSWEGRLMGR